MSQDLHTHWTIHMEGKKASLCCYWCRCSSLMPNKPQDDEWNKQDTDMSHVSGFAHPLNYPNWKLGARQESDWYSILLNLLVALQLVCHSDSVIRHGSNSSLDMFCHKCQVERLQPKISKKDHCTKWFTVDHRRNHYGFSWRDHRRNHSCLLVRMDIYSNHSWRE